MALFRPIAWCVFLAAGVLGAEEVVHPAAPAKTVPATAVIPPKVAVTPPPAADPSPALFADGLKALHSGDLAAAQNLFDRVAVLNSREWSCRAELLAIRLLGQKGDLTTAASRLEIFRRRPEAAAYRDRSDALELWLAAQADDPARFTQVWAAFQKSHFALPDAEVAAALEIAVEKSLAIRNFAAAEKLLSQSLTYQISDAARRSVLRREFSLCREPAAIGGIAERYARWFPDEEETANIQLQAAARLAQSGQPESAQKIWEQVAGNGSYPAALREFAAEAAAIAAEKSGNDAVSRTMHQSRIALSTDKFSARLNFGNYLLRTNDDPGAEAIFRELWFGNDPRREVAGAGLLRTLIKMKKTEDALTVAASLRDSAVYGRYAAIKLAELQERKGDLAAAREAYQFLLRRYPDDPLIAHVAYRIAVLAKMLNLPTAIAELVDFAEKYPADVRAPRALLQAMQTAGNADAAQSIFQRIAEKYFQDVLFPAAVQQQFLFEMASRHYDRATALSETYAKMLPDAEFGAAVGLAKLHLLFAAGKWQPAAALGKSLMERYPGAAAAAEIAFVCGNVESTLGRYPEALADYGRALQLRPAGELGDHARGRIADMEYMLFAATQQPEHLERAENTYRTLAEKSLFPAVKLEAFCRLGRTLELSGRYAESAVAYDKALFCAQEMKAEKRPLEAIWCYRAAYGAIRIRMRSSRRVEREAALRVVSALEALKIDDNYENFTALRRDIERKKSNKPKKR